MKRTEKILIAGHSGLVGAAIHRLLKAKGFSNIVSRSSSQLDLRSQVDVFRFMDAERPQYVFLCAATVGGIMANNTYPANFVFDNLAIQNNIIHASYMYNVKKLLFLGSSCIYPKLAPQPMKEDYLMTGMLEPTNDAYAIAKIAGIKMCQAYAKQYGCNFISVMPTNLYGPGDNYHLENSHVLPALIRKFYEATESGDDKVELWGTGTPRREFLHVDDLADACYFLMMCYNSPDIVNIGTGKDHSIKEVAEKLMKISGFKGDLVFDYTKPDGTPRKLLDVEKLTALGWEASIPLMEGIKRTYDDFKQNYHHYLRAKDRRQFANIKTSSVY